ncbi:hypothetical protein [Microvirga roseola]|uniref:hypothetical protein n=1 Tax=Microvirga roseola TaxID=2883126 RepID=UPI001E2EA523|nr:hypothetical protein [Microvirga roseola]
MATVLQSDLYVQSDLTGGRDSRGVLSLILAAASRVGDDLIRKVNIWSDRGSKSDFAVATQIAEKFCLRFMDRSEDSRTPVRMTAAEAYEKWKSLCLGVYGPIYFPQTRPVPTAVFFGGAGGEGHRRFYPNIAPNRFIKEQRYFLRSSAHYRKLKRDILEDLAFLGQGAEGSVDPMMLHYRHFRDRCHGGRAPQHGNLLSPLSSAVLRRASSLCSPEQIERSQVLADILINAHCELASMPYDSAGKTFDARHYSEAIDAVEAVRSASTTGRIFAADAASLEPGDFTKASVLRMLRDEFLTQYEHMRGTGFFPKGYLEGARRTAEEAALNGRFAHARSGCPISHIILAGELSRLQN